MAKSGSKLPSSFILLSFLAVCCSGTQVGFSYDGRQNEAISSAIETVSFLRKNNVSSSQIKVLVTDTRVLKTLSNSGVVVDLYFDVGYPKESTASVISWLKRHLVAHLPYVNISSVIVSSTGSSLVSQKKFSALLATLKSVHLGLRSLGLDHKVKVSTALPISMLESSKRWRAKDVRRVVDFIRKCRSFIVVETEIDGALSMGDHFLELMIKSASSAANLLRYKDVPIVLNVKSSAVPSAMEVAEFSRRMMTSLKAHAHITGRVSGVFAQISPIKEAEMKELDREEEQIFRSSRRELLNSNLVSTMKVTLHDSIYPPTPITIPQANPVPTIVTVPATNPVSVTPVNPTTTPMTVPPTNPVTSPSILPPTGNQVPPALTVPTAPPAIIDPAPPTGAVPITPPVATPNMNPVTPPTITNPPTTSGQMWCLAKTGVTESALQAALDYACGMGRADCSAIQPSGSCYNPNNAQSHASYAFNSYYQKNPAPSSCDFKGAAVLVNTNPSTGSCIYPSSSSSSSPSSLSPPATTSSLSSPPPATTTSSSSPPATTTTSSSPPATPSSGLPPFMLNSSNPDSSAPSIYGSSPPPGPSTSVSISSSLQPVFTSIMLVSFIVTGRLCRA